MSTILPSPTMSFLSERKLLITSTGYFEIFLLYRATTISPHDAVLKAFRTSRIAKAQKSFISQEPSFANFAIFHTSFIASDVDRLFWKPYLSSERPPFSSSSSVSLPLMSCSYSFPRESSKNIGRNFLVPSGVAVPFGNQDQPDYLPIPQEYSCFQETVHHSQHLVRIFLVASSLRW
jgi:hypothetical protein